MKTAWILTIFSFVRFGKGFTTSNAVRKPLALFSESLTVDANVYNVPTEKAAELWTATVNAEPRGGRPAGMPYLDTKSKDYFVDDLEVAISRDGGMGMNLIELAGGRDDGFGITIVESASGNAEKAGIIPGDSIASVQAQTITVDGTKEMEKTEQYDCECRDFDETIGLLTSFAPEVKSLILNIKRIRRVPKLNVVVEYPPSQCAEGADNKESLQLFAGENLRQGLMTRGIVFEDRDARKCDYCGGKCMVRIDTGMQLLSPKGMTEEKLMKNNPKCRVSCKTIVGYGMSEGNIRLRVNLNEWKEDEGKSSSPFFSR
mmetsp:Transcript_13609/g.20070  ORF Transcript_13609/g.20070 Transcript_13609/m.20070 type:complete len:316 (+) Transcript_13609:100-1047(+)